MSGAGEWDMKLAWMRAGGVVSARWDEGGTLLECSTGPAPSAAEENLELPALRAIATPADRRRMATAAASSMRRRENQG